MSVGVTILIAKGHRYWGRENMTNGIVKSSEQEVSKGADGLSEKDFVELFNKASDDTKELIECLLTDSRLLP